MIKTGFHIGKRDWWVMCYMGIEPFNQHEIKELLLWPAAALALCPRCSPEWGRELSAAMGSNRQTSAKRNKVKPVVMKPEALARLLCDVEEEMDDYRLMRLRFL